MAAADACELCTVDGGELIVRREKWRIVRVADAAFPAFYRVIWNRHIGELSDLSPADRSLCLETVVAVEQVLRQQLAPTKINLASLGNVTPHLHWHVIARFDWDSHFPQPIWGESQREPMPRPVERLAVSLATLDAAMRSAMT
jgi:diadenosine tetraphosphate (Ap4A) HIT family hydrolase